MVYDSVSSAAGCTLPSDFLMYSIVFYCTWGDRPGTRSGMPSVNAVCVATLRWSVCRMYGIPVLCTEVKCAANVIMTACCTFVEPVDVCQIPSIPAPIHGHAQIYTAHVASAVCTSSPPRALLWTIRCGNHMLYPYNSSTPCSCDAHSHNLTYYLRTICTVPSGTY